MVGIGTAQSGEERTTLGWVAALTVAVVVTGMGYTEWWEPVVYHLGYPLNPADFSQTLKDATVISRGGLFSVYSAHTQLVTLPGYPLLLAPVAAACRLLHLHQPWLLAGPFALATAGAVLAGADRLAVALGIERRRRRALLAWEAVAVWPVLVMWGHPEDALAVGLCCLCLAAVVEGRWRSAGWWLGAGLAAQLLAVLVVPVVLVAAGRRHLAGVVVRAALLPGVLAAAVVVPDFGAAWPALTGQPNYPGVDHPTPWILLAPSLGHGTVAAGPARILALLAAVGCGVAARHPAVHAGRATTSTAARATSTAIRADPDRLVWLVWLAALAFFARCLFEAVMDPYYVMPAVVVTLVLAAREEGARRLAAGLLCVALTVDTNVAFGMWTYWFLLAALAAVAAAATAPRGPRAPRGTPVGAGGTAGGIPAAAG